MINITKQGNNVIVTSDNPNSFHIGNGELSVPLNTIYYVLDDESDFIQFNSTEKGKILFNGTIGDIQVNGNIVNRENILMELDNVFNSSATGEGGGSTPEQYIKMLGEEYNNNLIWYMNQSDDYREIKFKTINGNTIMGEGNITIEGGGSSAGVSAINIGREVQDWTQKTGVVPFYTDMYDGSYDVAIDGMSFFGLKPIDNTIIIENAGGTVNGCFRGGIRVNPEVLGGGGGSADNGFSDWKTANLETNRNITLNPNGTIDDSEECVVIGNQSSSNGYDSNVLIGAESNANSGYGVAVGKNAIIHGYAGIAIGTNSGAFGEGSVAIGLNKSTDASNFRTNINDVIKGDYNDYAYIKNDYNQYVRIPTEWTGTQSEYDALGAYYDNVTYNIIEG